MSVNFKIWNSFYERFSHAYSLFVAVEKVFPSDTDYSYFVRASLHDSPEPVTLGYFFSTPDEAFEYMESIEKLYPRFGDDRDLSIKNSPEFDLNLIKKLRPSSATK